jgi:hypothetical protein
MQFIVNKLNGQGRVDYIETLRTDDTNAYDWHKFGVGFHDLTANACKLNGYEDWYHYWTNASEPFSRLRFYFSFAEVDRVTVSSRLDYSIKRTPVPPGKTLEYNPSIFVLQIEMQATKTILESNSNRPEATSSRGWSFTFREEEMAYRIRNAMLHAMELCGGGRKDPF